MATVRDGNNRADVVLVLLDQANVNVAWELGQQRGGPWAQVEVVHGEDCWCLSARSRQAMPDIRRDRAPPEKLMRS